MKIICIVLLQFCFHHSTKCGHFNFNDDEDTNQVNNVDVNSCEFNPKGLSPVIFSEYILVSRILSRILFVNYDQFYICDDTQFIYDPSSYCSI